MLDINNCYEAEPLEVKLRKATESNEPIESVAPMIYTEKEKGVQAGYDIRTDRFELAMKAMDAITKAEGAKSEAIPGETVTEVKELGREAGEQPEG